MLRLLHPLRRGAGVFLPAYFSLLIVALGLGLTPPVRLLADTVLNAVLVCLLWGLVFVYLALPSFTLLLRRLRPPVEAGGDGRFLRQAGVTASFVASLILWLNQHRLIPIFPPMNLFAVLEYLVFFYALRELGRRVRGRWRG